MAAPTISPRTSERLTHGFVNAVGVITTLVVALRLADGLLTNTNAMVALMGIAAILCVIALDLRAGLIVWLVLAPFGRMFNITMGQGLPDLGLSRLAAGLMLALLVAQIAAGRRRLPRMLPLDWAILAFMAGVLLSVPAAGIGLVKGIQTAFDFLVLPLLLYWFARNVQAGRRSLQWVLVAVAIASVTMAFITAREQLTDQTVLTPTTWRFMYSLRTRKITSLFGTAVFMASALSVPVPALFYAISRAKTLPGRVIWSSALAITLTGVLLTYVRGVWLSTALSLAVMALLSRGPRRRLLPLFAVLAVALILFGGLIINPQAIQERLGSENPIEYRINATAVSMKIVREHPLLGVGWDNFYRVAVGSGFASRSDSSGLPDLPATHSLYLWVITSAGLVGFIPFLALLGLILWQGIALWRGQLGRTERTPRATGHRRCRSRPGRGHHRHPHQLDDFRRHVRCVGRAIRQHAPVPDPRRSHRRPRASA